MATISQPSFLQFLFLFQRFKVNDFTLALL
jgi:hypothetical protein